MNDSSIIVSSSELEELKKQAEEINRKIAELSAPANLAWKCKVKPYDLPGFDHFSAAYPAVFTDSYNRKAWECFLTLGKIVHSQNGVFKMQKRSSYSHTLRRVTECGRIEVSKVSELTHVQAEVAAEMLEKMISIYNEYMVKLHTHVILEDPVGIKSVVPVMPPS